VGPIAYSRLPVPAKRIQQGAIAVAATAGAVLAAVAARIAYRSATRAIRTARTVFLAATFQLNRRCPDCKSKIRRDARVCGHCGFRLRPERGKR
jgi:hypothetical protein